MRIFESMVVKRTMKATAKFINSKKSKIYPVIAQTTR